MSIKITITDDHPLVVSGLQKILQPSENIEVIATYFSGQELMLGLKVLKPDVLLTDLQMPGKLLGIDLIRAIRRLHPELPILVLSGQEALFNITEVMEAGCKGYLLKNTTDPEMLEQAIVDVYKGGIFLEPSLRDELLRGILKTKKENEAIASIVSRREIEILELIKAGYTSREISDKLYLSIRTIESHRHRLLQKLDAKNVVELLKKATELGLLV